MDVQDFRVWLAHILRRRSADVRRRFGDRLPTVEELEEIALLVALASDARNVSDHVVLLFHHMLSIDDIAGRVSPVVDEYLERIGRDVFPRNATDVVRQTMREACRLPRIGKPETVPTGGNYMDDKANLPCHPKRDRLAFQRVKSAATREFANSNWH